MFNRLQSWKDEIQRNLEVETTPEPSGASSVEDLEVYENLPNEIKVKLKRLAKYDLKYPQLLDSYKRQKEVITAVQEFEKMLQEATPCSGIAEPQALKDYLSSMEMKTTMVSEELNRVRKELETQKKLHEEQVEKLKSASKSENIDSVAQDEGEGTQPEDTLPESGDHVSTPSVVEGQEDTKTKDLENELTQVKEEHSSLQTENKKLRNTNEELQMKLDSQVELVQTALAEKDSAAKELKTLKGTVEEDAKLHNSKIAALENEIDFLTSSNDGVKNDLITLRDKETILELENRELETKLEKMTEKNSSLVEKSNQINTLQEELTSKKSEITVILSKIEVFETQITEKDTTIKSLTSEIDTLKSTIDTSSPPPGAHADKSIPSEPPTTASTASTSSSSSKKNKKKKNNKKKDGKTNDGNDVPVKDSEEIPDVHETPLHTESAAASSSESSEELESLKQEHQALHSKHVELETEHNTLKQQFETTTEELQSIKTELKTKSDEVGIVRDMLKDVGNDLVTARDGLKEFTAKNQILVEEHNSLTSEYELLKNSQGDVEVGKKLAETVESQKVELEVLRGQHSQAMTEYEMEKTESLKLIKQLQSSLGEKDLKIEELEKLLNGAKSEVKSVTMELNALTRAKSTIEKDLESLQIERSQLIQQKSKLDQELQELSKIKKSEESLKQELAKVNGALMHREKTIVYFEKQVKDYEVLKLQLLDENTKSKSANRELTIRSNSHQDAANRFSREKSQLMDQLNELKKKFEEAVDESRRLSDKCVVLQDKYDGLQEMKSTSNDQVESIKSQCEELSISVKEERRRAESLEEELSEARTMLQERTREATTIRRLLMERDQDQDFKVVELSNKLKSVNEERDRVQSESSMTLTRKQRELDELMLKNSELEKFLKDWTTKESELTRELQDLRNVKKKLEKETQSTNSSSDELSGVIVKMRESMGASEKKVRDYENLNNTLKRLNEELNSKMDRLMKNYKMVSAQLKEQKQTLRSSSQPSPHSSPVSTRSNSVVSNLHMVVESNANNGAGHTSIPENSANGSADPEKIAYIKNVLLGFLEHKDQRQQLLPVVSMLLQLTKADEKRLVSAL